ncbi:unnamed protein product [Rhizoctonia solani]|uniref:CHAT domain-containing protein n=1 Tax=Rhizoctonia solani TaxID=456999 RepID=A0A8H3GKY2_9AGAM|nr:unnamed protein product [Rhizoctonia solani]
MSHDHAPPSAVGDQSDLRSQFVNLGEYHFSRFRELGEPGDIDKAIDYMSMGLNLTPGDHPGLPRVLTSLGASHQIQFQRLGKLDDLQKAVEYMSIARTLIPDDCSCFPLLLNNLATSYDARFERLGEPDDLDQSIGCRSRALTSTPSGHPYFTTLLTNLGTSHSIRFSRLGQQGDAEKAVEYLSSALTLTPGDHPDLPLRLRNLGAAYGDRFDCLADLADLEKAIEYESRALALIPSDHPEFPSVLNNLGGSHTVRFQHLGGIDDIEKTIEYLSAALKLTSDDHPRLPVLLSNLGVSHTDRFWRLGEPADLEKAIACDSRALALTPDGHPQLPSRLSHLGTSHTVRFRSLGELDDIEKAIKYMSIAYSLTPSDHPNLISQLGHLGTSHSIRFEILGELGDIEKAIEYGSRAISLAPKGHSDLPSLLVNLGAYHGTRFQRVGDPSDLEQAIACQSRALSVTPDAHPHLPSLLVNLGVSHSLRFTHLGELHDLEEAIQCGCRALTLTPDGHTDLPTWLASLGVSYSLRFEHLHELCDLEKAIEFQSRALALTPNGDPGLPVRYHGLARFQLFHSLSTGEPSDMQDSLHSFRQASQSLFGAPGHKFAAALEWANFASKLSALKCIEAYQTAINLLPQFIWLGATTHQRYQNLDQTRNLAVRAAAAAISSLDYQLALEWLEHARCVVWNQSLMLRSPLDGLASSHPSLAARLLTVANQLHHVSTESQASRELCSNAINSEQAAQHHRRLAKEYNELLSQSRQLPDFEDFLQPMKAINLIRSARSGPVVVVNCDRDRCDALLILPGKDEIIHVPLQNFTGEMAWRCRSELEASLRRKGIRERGFKVRQEAGDKDDIESVLTNLWNNVVKPVIDVLGYMDNVSTDNLPHVTWCPTGALSFLPLHAAGDYNGPRPRVFDYIISSYTPTLTALLVSTPSILNHDSRVLAIGQANTPGCSSLPGTTKELEYMKAHTQAKAKYSQLISNQATTTAVLDAMEAHDWVHLACHAHQNVKDPTKSGFYLHDGTLDLASINQRSFKNKGLAFLSACHTAAGDEKLPDEAVHLASGMLMAGYASVIATMWSVRDVDAPLVADKVYTQLMKDGKLGNGEAGRALHNAIAVLRDKVGEKEFGRWVPYIHIGS